MLKAINQAEKPGFGSGEQFMHGGHGIPGYTLYRKDRLGCEEKKEAVLCIQDIIKYLNMCLVGCWFLRKGLKKLQYCLVEK